MLEAHLAQAERHVTKGHQLVEEQRERIVALERDGHDTTRARDLLVTLETIEQMHIADRDRISQELKHFRGPDRQPR